MPCRLTRARSLAAERNAVELGPLLERKVGRIDRRLNRHVPATNGGLGPRGIALGLNTEASRQTWLAQMEYEFF